MHISASILRIGRVRFRRQSIGSSYFSTVQTLILSIACSQGTPVGASAVVTAHMLEGLREVPMGSAAFEESRGPKTPCAMIYVPLLRLTCRWISLSKAKAPAKQTKAPPGESAQRRRESAGCLFRSKHAYSRGFTVHGEYSSAPGACLS